MFEGSVGVFLECSVFNCLVAVGTMARHVKTTKHLKHLEKQKKNILTKYLDTCLNYLMYQCYFPTYFFYEGCFFFWGGVKDDTMMMKNDMNNSLMVNTDVMKK